VHRADIGQQHVAQKVLRGARAVYDPAHEFLVVHRDLGTEGMKRQPSAVIFSR